jgi:hypothetical protein
MRLTEQIGKTITIYSFDTLPISFATTSSNPMTSGSPINPLALFAYKVPPSVQIRLKVATVAAGFPASQAAASTSLSLANDVREISQG